jgi:hypothetical protein
LHQQWRHAPGAGPFICVGSNLCLDIGRDANRGPNIIQWEFHGSWNQIFDYNPITLKIQSRDGRFLDVKGPVAAGSTLCAGPGGPVATQRWVIRTLANPWPIPPVTAAASPRASRSVSSAQSAGARRPLSARNSQSARQNVRPNARKN